MLVDGCLYGTRVRSVCIHGSVAASDAAADCVAAAAAADGDAADAEAKLKQKQAAWGAGVLSFLTAESQKITVMSDSLLDLWINAKASVSLASTCEVVEDHAKTLAATVKEVVTQHE